MIQREAQHDVQTLETTELDRLLDRPLRLTPSKRPVTITRPAHAMPSRDQIIDEVVARNNPSAVLERLGLLVIYVSPSVPASSLCPLPDKEIVYGSIFFHQIAPTNQNQQYVRCLFLDSDFEPSDGRHDWEIFDSVCERSNVLSHLVNHTCRMIGSVVI
jgi:hypothetical protein